MAQELFPNPPAPINWDDYRKEHRDHFHALGVLISLYNQLEFDLMLIFCEAHNMTPANGQKIFAALNNFQRIDFTREKLEASPINPQLKDRLKHFVDAYETITENRNFLAHSSTIINTKSQEHITFGKGSKTQPDKWSFVHLTLMEIRKVCEETHALIEFHGAINLWQIAQKYGGTITFPQGSYMRPPLPKIPPLPEKLKNVPHGVLERPKSQPGSSPQRAEEE